MSEPLATTFVSIVPLTDEASFKAQAEQQVQAAVAGVKADVKVGVGVDVAALRAQLQQVSAGIKEATSLGVAPTAIPGLTEQADKLAASLEQVQTEMNAAADGGAAIGSQVTALTSEFNALAAAAQEAGAAVGGGTSLPDGQVAQLVAAREQAIADAEAKGEAAVAARAKALASGQLATEESTAAAEAYAAAGVAAAKADVDLVAATGKLTSTYQSSLVTLEKNIALTNADTAATEANTVAHVENAAGVGKSTSARRFTEEAFRGQVPIAEFARFIPQLFLGAAAFEAFLKVSEKVQESLKVEGDEAATTEGKLRNFTAALVGGDLVGGVEALLAKGKSLTDQFEELKVAIDDGKESSGQAAVDLRALADEAEKNAGGFRDLASESGKAGDSLHDTFSGADKDLISTAEHARALADALDTAVQAAQDVASAIATAGGEAQRFGEAAGPEGRGAGSVTRGNARAGVGQQSTVDTTDTEATRAGTAQANADTTAKQLAEAKREKAAIDRELANDQAQGIVDGIAKLKEQQAQAARRVRDLDKQLAAEQEKVVDTAADARERALKINLQLAQTRTESTADDRQALEALKAFYEEKAANTKLSLEAQQQATSDALNTEAQIQALDKQAANAAQAALEARLDARERDLKLAVQTAEANDKSVADDKKALAALAAFYHQKSLNTHLEKDVRQQALADEKTTRAEINAINKQQLATALEVREQNLRNAIDAAKLTPGGGDDDKANKAFQKFLEGRVAAAKGDALALAKAKGELIQFKLQLQGDAKSGNAFTLQDLFQEAANEQRTFGSNISDNGPLSGQDARSAFAGIVTDKGVGTAQAQLTEAQRQTLLLASINSKIGGTTSASRVKSLVSAAGNAGGWRAAREAAAYGYGVN